MASRSEFKVSRSEYRENRYAIREIIERQNTVIDREFLFTTTIFRAFFLIGSLVVMLARQDALVGAIPLFLVISMTWAYRTSLNERINSYAIRWTEKILFNEASRYAHLTASEEERDQDFVDDLIRIRTMRPNGSFLYLEPVALCVGAISLIIIRLGYPSLSHFF
jgi:hypothetical protein